MLFGRKKPEGNTFLVVDVETGSVGGALVYVVPGRQPKLFGQQRVWLPVPIKCDTATLMRELLEGVNHVVTKAAELAARMRTHEQTEHIGQVGRAALFFSPPWGRPNLARGKPDFALHVTDRARAHVQALFGEVPTSLHTGASAARHGMRGLYPEAEDYLLCIVTGEITELLHVHQGAVVGHATLPTGSNATVRTLRSHAGLSEAEARSALRLRHLKEPLDAAGIHFAGELKEALQAMLQNAPIKAIYVLSEEAPEWYASALSQNEELQELFPEGGVVRAIGPKRAQVFVEAHAPNPDTRLVLLALSVASYTTKNS